MWSPPARSQLATEALVLAPAEVGMLEVEMEVEVEVEVEWLA